MWAKCLRSRCLRCKCLLPWGRRRLVVLVDGFSQDEDGELAEMMLGAEPEDSNPLAHETVPGRPAVSSTRWQAAEPLGAELPDPPQGARAPSHSASGGASGRSRLAAAAPPPLAAPPLLPSRGPADGVAEAAPSEAPADVPLDGAVLDPPNLEEEPPPELERWPPRHGYEEWMGRIDAYTSMEAAMLMSLLPHEKWNFQYIRDEDQGAGDSECRVCLEEFVPDGEIVRLPCMHYAHTRCMEEWLLRSSCCPVCRTNVREVMGNSEFEEGLHVG